MSKFSDKFNKVAFDVDTTDFEYAKLNDLYKENGKDVITKVAGMFIHKGKLGEQPVFIAPEIKKLVNIPSFMCDTVREILADADAVKDIRDGKVGFTLYEYESHNKKCYGVRFVDL